MRLIKIGLGNIDSTVGAVDANADQIVAVARAMAAEAHAQVRVVERAVRLQERLPEGAHGVVIGLDRGSVPMAEERAPGQPPATPRRTRSEPYVRAVPAPIDVNWRMAPVATVSVTDAEGNALVTRKYAATAADGFEGIVKRAMADVAAAVARMLIVPAAPPSVMPPFSVVRVRNGVEDSTVSRMCIRAVKLVRSIGVPPSSFQVICSGNVAPR